MRTNIKESVIFEHRNCHQTSIMQKEITLQKER